MTEYRIINKNGDFVTYANFKNQDRFLRQLMRQNYGESFEIKHSPFSLQKKENNEWKDLTIKLVEEDEE